MTAQSIFEKMLKDQRQSVTQPRQAVFDALQHHKHLPMRELVAACSAVNRASIYRTVEVFEAIGIIKRVPSGWKYRLELGEAFLEHHHHATCRLCGASVSLPKDAILEKRLHELAVRRNFKPESHQIELIGLCEACQSDM